MVTREQGVEMNRNEQNGLGGGDWRFAKSCAAEPEELVLACPDLNTKTSSQLQADCFGLRIFYSDVMDTEFYILLTQPDALAQSGYY